MSKRKSIQKSGSILSGEAVFIVSMFLLLCLEALLVRNGTLGVKEIPMISVMICLFSSVSGNAFGPKGEGREKARLLTALIPLAILFSLNVAATGGRFGTYVPFYAIGLLLPGVVFFILGKSFHRKGRKRLRRVKANR